jgi:diguanylate cyclase (GGDEF)-like protein
MSDKVLHEVANRLTGCFDSTDVVGRISGDRFAVFLNAAVDAEELVAHMSHLQSQLSFEVDGIAVTCSCGISKFPDCGKNFDELYQAADRALIQAKEAGKNCFCFSEQCKK